MESLRIPASLDSLKRIRDFVKEAAAAAGLGQHHTYKLTLAIDEIATNIITHGYYEAGRTGDILVHANLGEGEVEITLEDTGIPFNPLTHADPANLDAPLAERDIGGLGVFLAQQNVDEFRYAFENGRNHNIFVMRSQPSGDPSLDQDQ
jgi:serine/threonine-protein kinase RsbW